MFTTYEYIIMMMKGLDHIFYDRYNLMMDVKE